MVFQYFSIKPMRNLSPIQGIWAAIKADTFSISAFQLGMYGWMALVFFVLFPHPHLHPNQPQYWFMMQVAMICGFVTSYPMNRLLIKMGWKEVMG
jgi:putative flippase GtrA